MALIKYILASLSTEEKVELFKRLYEQIACLGVNGDTELAHINKYEGAILKLLGGAGTINEATGLGQYFGGSPPPPPPATQTVTQQATIPDEMKPYVTDILSKSQAIQQQKEGEGYVPYAGQQIAGFQPEQEQAQAGLAGLVGSGQPYFDQATTATQQAAQGPTTENIGQYMSPYMQNVVDIQKREAMRMGDVAQQGLNTQAVNAGAFGGSRDAIMQAEQGRNLQTQLGDIQAKGQAAAYADAQNMFTNQQKNLLTAGTQFGQLATAVPGQAMKEFGALESVGAAKQQQEQQALDLARSQFIQEKEFPMANLQQYSSIIRGYNMPPNTYTNSATQTPAPSYLQQIAGLGMAGAGVAGAFGGFGKKAGGLVGLAQGGKVLRRATAGSLSPEQNDGMSDMNFSEMTSTGLTKYAFDRAFGPDARKRREDYEEAATEQTTNLEAARKRLGEDRYGELAKAGFKLLGADGTKSMLQNIGAIAPESLDALKQISKEDAAITQDKTKVKLALIAKKENMDQNDISNLFAGAKLLSEGAEDREAKRAIEQAKLNASVKELSATAYEALNDIALAAAGIDAIYNAETGALQSINKQPLEPGQLKILNDYREQLFKTYSILRTNGYSDAEALSIATRNASKQRIDGDTPPTDEATGAAGAAGEGSSPLPEPVTLTPSVGRKV